MATRTPTGDDLQRYAPTARRPVTLATEFFADLLELTGGGRARDFENARDHGELRAVVFVLQPILSAFLTTLADSRNEMQPPYCCIASC